MEIVYQNKNIKEQCTNLKRAKKDFSDKVARKIKQKINFIESAETLSDVIKFAPLRFHALTGNRAGLYAMDINGRNDQYRFIACFDGYNKTQIFAKAKVIKIIQIMEVSKHYG